VGSGVLGVVGRPNIELVLARRCAERGGALLKGKKGEIFADELVGQIAIECGQLEDALKIFARLRMMVQEASRAWFVFSLRLSDALERAGETEKNSALLGFDPTN
jgi:hypothetical protein